MSSYADIKKVEWIIEVMSKQARSRQELLKLASERFPDIPWKTLEGTLGQYWTDTANPLYSKWLRDRGLTVIQEGLKRLIVKV